MDADMHWLVTCMYEMPHIEEYMDAKSLLVKLISELEKHLGAKIRRFGKEMDGSGLYLISSLGALSLTTEEKFEIKGFFVDEQGAEKFKNGLINAVKHALPKEIADEMASTLTIVETGAELTLES